MAGQPIRNPGDDAAAGRKILPCDSSGRRKPPIAQGNPAFRRPGAVSRKGLPWIQGVTCAFTAVNEFRPKRPAAAIPIIKKIGAWPNLASGSVHPNDQRYSYMASIKSLLPK
jgi:hypothetical protein